MRVYRTAMKIAQAEHADLEVVALAALLQRKNYYFIPFGQDDSYKKPCSLKSDFTLLPDTLEAALRGVQIQPMLL